MHRFFLIAAPSDCWTPLQTILLLWTCAYFHFWRHFNFSSSYPLKDQFYFVKMRCQMYVCLWGFQRESRGILFASLYPLFRYIPLCCNEVWVYQQQCLGIHAHLCHFNSLTCCWALTSNEKAFIIMTTRRWQTSGRWVGWPRCPMGQSHWSQGSATMCSCTTL